MDTITLIGTTFDTSWNTFANGYFQECNKYGECNGNLINFPEPTVVNFYAYDKDGNTIFTYMMQCTQIDADNNELPAIETVFFTDKK